MRYSDSQTKYINSKALTTAVSVIVDLKKKKDVYKVTTVAINDVLNTTYNDDVPCQMICVDNTEPYYCDRLTAINHNKIMVQVEHLQFQEHIISSHQPLIM